MPKKEEQLLAMTILPKKIVTAALMELVFTDFFSSTLQMKVFVGGAAVLFVLYVVRRLVDLWDYIEAGREERNRMRSEKRSFTWRKRDS